ncbi:MAG: response regulator [Terracidiphilus sp.]
MLNGKARRVLIVDDAPWVSDTLAVIFSTSGFEARAAHTAEQALEIAEDWEPSLAIIDVGLPKMNGVDLAIFFAEDRPSCRILLFSGQSSAVDTVEKAAERGYHFELLSKPIHPNVMLSRATRMLSLWRSPDL